MKKIIALMLIFLCALTTLYAQENDSLNPPVREGGYGDAIAHSSKHNLLVLFIFGAKGEKDSPEKYTAKQYAELLKAGFKDSRYTNYPTNIVVFYQESGEYGPTVARVLINGRDYKTDSGASTFSPSLIGNHIDVFTKYYREQNNISLDYEKTDKDNN